MPHLTHPTHARVFVHAPVPPFPLIAGPIEVVNIQNSTALSKDSTASFDLALPDVDDVRWILPGMCWRIDLGYLGQPPWAGFIAPQVVPLDATTVTISLIGPKEALLSQPLAARFPDVIAPGAAVAAAIESAQSFGSPILLGDSGDMVGPALPIVARGENVSQFITSMLQVCSCDYRERVELSGNALKFYLDFGIIKEETGIVLGRDDLVDGSFTSDRIPSTFTAFGAGPTFAERNSVNVQPTEGTVPPVGAESQLSASESYVRLLSNRAIGPAAVKHVTSIQERFSEGIIGIAEQQHDRLLEFVDEFVLVLRNTETSSMVQLGDVVNLRVPGWALGVDVDAMIHIREITPNDGDGTRDIVASVLF